MQAEYAGSVPYLVDAKHSTSITKMPTPEVEGARDLGGEGGRKGYASLAEGEHERTFSLHDEVSDPAVGMPR